MAAGSPPDLVLLDVMMPGMSGWVGFILQKLSWAARLCAATEECACCHLFPEGLMAAGADCAALFPPRSLTYQPHCRCPPALCSYEVARFLRVQYPHMLLPIIMVSANRLEDHVVEGLQVGIFLRVLKSCTEFQLKHN